MESVLIHFSFLDCGELVNEIIIYIRNYIIYNDLLFIMIRKLMSRSLFKFQ